MQSKHDANRVRAYNQKKIYDLIRTNKGISRAEIAPKIGISPTSVGKITAIMIEDGLVAECGISEDSGIGRKGIQLMVVANKVLSIAVTIDIGAICGAIVNIDGETLFKTRQPMPSHFTFEAAVDCCTQIIGQLLKRLTAQQQEDVVAIGVSVPGFVAGGHVYHSPQLFWQDVPLGEALNNRFNQKIIVENNVKADALTECVYGNIGTHNNILVLSMGSGVGGALIRNGRLLRGAHSALGEIGHILVGSNGSKCDCGRYGCLRTHIAKPSLEKVSGKSFEDCLLAARNGDEKCQAVLDDAVKYASVWMANCIAIYDPAEIVLTGDLFTDWPEFYDLVQENYGQYVWHPLKNKIVHVRKSIVLADKHPTVSAACIVFYQYLKTGIQLDADVPL